MKDLRKKSELKIEKISMLATRWIGSTSSLLVHTLIFVISFALYFYGIEIDKILLVLTTIVSLEAIYLSIFIQMSVNRQARNLKRVAKDIDDIQEDVEDIQEDIDDIQENIDDIQEDVEDIQEEDEDDKKDDIMLNRIEDTLGKLIEEVIDLKKQHLNHLKKVSEEKKKKKN
jgi:uncharacterized protein YoxC